MNANDLISQWMGKECTCVTELDSENIVDGIPQYTTYWGNCAMHGNGGVSIPWQTSDRRAVELLPVLVEKGHTFKMLGAKNNYYFEIGLGLGYSPMITVERCATISEAITAAVLQLIEREKL